MLEFYQTILGVDVWREIDTKSGKITYQFYFDGKPYERDTEYAATILIKDLFNLKKAHEVSRRR